MQLLVTVGPDVRVHRSRQHDLGPEPQPHAPARCSARGGFHVAGVVVTWARALTVVLAIVLAVGLRILLFRTRLGVSMRAVVDNRGLASLVGRPLRAGLELLVGARLLARRAGRHPARARHRHVDERPAHAADHHVVRGRGRRPDPQPAADLPRRGDPRPRDAVVAVVPAVRRALGDRARRDPDGHAVRRAAAAPAGAAPVRAAQRRAPHRARLDRARHRDRHDRRCSS